MANPDRDTAYSSEGTNRSVYTRESSSTGWFVGIIVALALLAIGYLVFSANSGPSTPSSSTVDVNNTPAVTAPATEPATQAPATEPAPMVQAPATGTETAPATPAEPATTPTESAAPAETTAPAPAPATGG